MYDMVVFFANICMNWCHFGFVVLDVIWWWTNDHLFTGSNYGWLCCPI